MEVPIQRYVHSTKIDNEPPTHPSHSHFIWQACASIYPIKSALKSRLQKPISLFHLAEPSNNRKMKFPILSNAHIVDTRLLRLHARQPTNERTNPHTATDNTLDTYDVRCMDIF